MPEEERRERRRSQNREAQQRFRIRSISAAVPMRFVAAGGAFSHSRGSWTRALGFGSLLLAASSRRGGGRG